jgi:hypothetical protein
MAMGVRFLGRGRFYRVGIAGTHLLGAAVGGALAGACLGLLGLALHLHEWRVPVVALGVVAALALRGRRSLGIHRQVPRARAMRLPPTSLFFVWGIMLGTGLATLIPYSVLLLLASVELTAPFALAVMCGVVFGLSREVPVLLHDRAGRIGADGLTALLPRWRGLALRANIAVILAAGGTFVFLELVR